MAEYIEREAVIEAVERNRSYVGGFRFGTDPDYALGYHQGLSFALVDICCARAANVRPVVQGEWRRTTVNLSACSACGNCVLTDRTGGYFFCPKCGADMRKEPPEEEKDE